MKRDWNLIAVLGTIFLLAGCGGKGPADSSAAKPGAPVEAEPAEQRSLTRTATYIGSIEPVRLARMASPAEGPVVECSVREGDRVAEDQPLVRVGRSLMAEAGLAAAREELQRREADFRRVEQLVRSGSMPGEQLEIARAALKRAQAQVAAAATTAGDYDIRAPWAGVVSRVWVAEGNYVAPRAPLVDIYDPESLRVRFAVPEDNIRRIAAGMQVRVRLDAWPDRVFAAEIERVYPQLEPLTRTLTVEAALDSDVDLFSGLFARVEVPVETVTDAVTVPSGALLVLPGGETAAFVVEEEKARRRLVEVGLESGGLAEIVEGIAAGEEVIVRGQEKLEDGRAVRVMGNKPEGGEKKGAE